MIPYIVDIVIGCYLSVSIMDKKLTPCYMMAVARYFNTSRDFINLMRVNRKYRNFHKMFRYNPISDCRLFSKIETQHFYEYRDIFYRNRDMFSYVYWVNKSMLEEYLAMIDTTKCVFKSSHINKMVTYAVHRMNLPSISNVMYDCDLFTILPTLSKAIVVMEYNDVYFGFTVNHKIKSMQRLFDTTYFNKDVTINNVLVTLIDIVTGPTIYVRDSNLDELLILYKRGKRFLVQTDTKRFKYFPTVMDIVNWCIITYE